MVAQAQLIVAVGAAKTKQLREINIRTIFDLEKALFNEAFGRRLLSILIADVTSTDAAGSPKTAGQSATSTPIPWWNGHLHNGTSEVDLDYREFLQAIVGLLRDDLHVLRLRQIWDVIRQRLVKRPYPAAPSPPA